MSTVFVSFQLPTLSAYLDPMKNTTAKSMTTSSQPRSFGILFSILIASLALYFFRNQSHLFILSIALSITLLLLALVKPAYLAPMTRLWLVFGLKLSKITNPIIVGVIYFVFLFPVALLMRLLGKDELKLKRTNVEQTYWRQVDPDETELHNY